MGRESTDYQEKMMFGGDYPYFCVCLRARSAQGPDGKWEVALMFSKDKTEDKE